MLYAEIFTYHAKHWIQVFFSLQMSTLWTQGTQWVVTCSRTTAPTPAHYTGAKVKDP